MIRLFGLLSILVIFTGCATFRNDLQSFQSDLPKYEYKIYSESIFGNKGPAYAKFLNNEKQEVIKIPLRKAATFVEGSDNRIKIRLDGDVVLTFEWVNSERKYYLVDEPITINGTIYQCDWDSITYAKWVDPESGKVVRKKLAPNLKYYLAAHKIKQGELVKTSEVRNQTLAVQHYSVNRKIN